MARPLDGVRIIEVASMGPAPFCAMMLADHGAEVIRIERPSARHERGRVKVLRPGTDILSRSRQSIVVDLKAPEGRSLVRDLARNADGLIEGFRPGVMERLGLGPDLLLADNPRLAYGRMTGWGQEGPLAQAPGHDINYIAMAGVLHGMGHAGERPAVPLNLVGDFGGGGMLLAFGMLAAILHARATGRGQVVDCAMIDGAALLTSMIWGMRASDAWTDERGSNLLDGGAPFYDSYECRDGRHICVGALEPQFYAALLAILGIAAEPPFDRQMDKAGWPAMRSRFAAEFRRHSRDEWVAISQHGDACISPVLTMAEATECSHNRARECFVTVEGVTQPAPAPRFSAAAASSPRPGRSAGIETEAVLGRLGIDRDRVKALIAGGILEGAIDEGSG